MLLLHLPAFQIVTHCIRPLNSAKPFYMKTIEQVSNLNGYFWLKELNTNKEGMENPLGTVFVRLYTMVLELPLFNSLV